MSEIRGFCHNTDQEAGIVAYGLPARAVFVADRGAESLAHCLSSFRGRPGTLILAQDLRAFGDTRSAVAETMARLETAKIHVIDLTHERVGTHGYVEISIDEVNPHTGYERRYVLKHRWLWEQTHGPIPDGMVLKCRGDHLNTDLSNWELIPRALLPRLNGRFGRNYDQAPANLKQTIMAVAKLEHQIRAKAIR